MIEDSFINQEIVPQERKALYESITSKVHKDIHFNECLLKKIVNISENQLIGKR